MKAILNPQSKQIEVTFAYSPSLVRVMQSIADSFWHKKTRTWLFPATRFHAGQLITKLQPFGFQLDPRLHALVKPTQTFTLAREGLYPYQSEAVDFMHSRAGRVLVADEMGLGKTVEVLTYAKELHLAGKLERMLIVTTASTVWKWAAEIERWLGRPYLVISSGKDQLRTTYPIWLMSSAIMTKLEQQLAQHDYTLIVADECHQYANPKTQRTKVLQKLVHNTTHFLPMSGTPMLNRPIELFPILSMLRPWEYPSWYKFAVRYADGHKGYFGFDSSGASNLEELRQRMADVMVRRVKGEVLEQLPDLTRVRHPIEGEQEEITNALYSLRARAALVGREKMTANPLVELAGLRQALGYAKVAPTVELVSDYLTQTEGRKVVVYAHHKEVVKLLAAGLKAYHPLTIVGDVPQAERFARTQSFQNKPNHRVMIISSAGGEGIDLYAADLIIFAEREWNPAREEQAEARLHRIGQKNAVSALYLVVRDSVDEKIADLIEAKRDLTGQLMAVNTVETEIASEVLCSLLSNT